MLLRLPVSKLARGVAVEQIRLFIYSRPPLNNDVSETWQHLNDMSTYKVKWIPAKAVNGAVHAPDQDLCVMTYNVLAPKYTATGYIPHITNLQI